MPKFAVGTIGATIDSDGTKVWEYVQAEEAITAPATVVINKDGQAHGLTTARDIPSRRLGQAPETDFADNEYGWVQRYGKSIIEVDGAVDVDATAGVIATDEAGHITHGATNPQLFGIQIVEDIADDATGEVFLHWPQVANIG